MDQMVQRLRTTVIKAGLRKINLAYSRIPLQSVCKRLGMSSVEDTKWVVAKAIRDGVIEASLDHKTQYMISSGITDVYRTKEPSAEFQKRTDFLFNVYQDAMKAMRFPIDFEKEEQERKEAEEKAIAAKKEEEENKKKKKKK